MIGKDLDKLEELPGIVTYNLGTGNGYSVLDMVKAFEKASGRTINYEISIPVTKEYYVPKIIRNNDKLKQH